MTALVPPFGKFPALGVQTNFSSGANITSCVGNLISGSAQPNTSVFIFANGIYIGTTASNSSGFWSFVLTSGGGLATVSASTLPSTSAQASPYSPFNPTYKSTGQTLSNLNNTVTDIGPSGYKTIIGTFSRSTGKWYFEITVGPVGQNNGSAVGITTNSFSATSQLGAGNPSDALRPDGYHYINGSYTNPGYTYTAGSVIGVIVDLVNNYIYYSKNGTLYSGNPITVTGGFALSASSTWFPACNTYVTNDYFTLNTGGSAFQTSPPSGFLPWG